MLLMVDNYDSFTFNLVQYFGELGEDVKVVRNDEVDVAAIDAMRPAALVLSPGPCTPAEAGVCVDAIRAFAGKLPILGVCLGHQAIGAALGGKVVRAASTRRCRSISRSSATTPSRSSVRRCRASSRSRRRRATARSWAFATVSWRRPGRRSKACSSIRNRSSPSMATPC